MLRFGFTSHDPATLIGVLPKYACPDFTNKPGHWAKALAERLCDRGSLLQYYVTSSGDVHFSIDGDDKGIFFSGVETRGPLWALLDVYGNCTGVKFVDSRNQLNNARREDGENTSSGSVHNVDDDEIDRTLVPALRAANIDDGWRPAMLHRTHGKHIAINSGMGIATRERSEFCQGYIFTARPLAPGERLMIKILDTDPTYTGALALGLTSCDPSRLSSRDLPDDSDMLLDRPEYWVVSKDVAGTPRVGEELVLSVSGIGEVKVSRNGLPPVTVMYVDYTLRLWAFLDVYGSTKSVQVFTRPPPAVLVVALPPAHNAANHLVAAAQSHMQVNQSNIFHRPNFISLSYLSFIYLQSVQTFSSSSSSITSLPVSLNAPLSPPSLANHRNIMQQSAMPASNNVQHQPIPRASSANILHHMPATTISPQVIQMPQNLGNVSSSTNVVIASQAMPTTVVQSAISGTIHQIANPSSSTAGVVGECTICYEQQIDSVLYMCGHMCMCYRCAVQQWRGKGGGQCPMCRAPIRDVIRTYKS